jgi:hypothetical protein
MGTMAEALSRATIQSEMSSFFSDKMGLISVKAYGAVGDGVTDDTQAIQAAVNAAKENGNILIFFPHGNYLSDELTDTGGLVFLGDNSSFVSGAYKIMQFGANSFEPGLINAMAYGAVGDGVTDDTEALQEIITAGFKGTIFIPAPPVHYLITSTISIPGQTKIVFASKGAKFRYTGTGACISMDGDRSILVNPHVEGIGDNFPATENEQIGIMFNAKNYCEIYSPRIFNLGRGVQFWSYATGNEGHYNTIYSPEIRHCYRGVTTEDSPTYTGEQVFVGGRISACYNGFYSDAMGGDIKFLGTAFEGGAGAMHLAYLAGGSHNAFLGCRFEKAEPEDPGIYISATANYTRIIGGFLCPIEDNNPTSIIDAYDNGALGILTRKEMVSIIGDNIIKNGDMRGNLRIFADVNTTRTFVPNGGLYGDAVTITGTSTTSNNYAWFSVPISAGVVDRKMTVSLHYKRHGTQQARLRVGSTSKPTIANWFDRTSDGWTTAFLTVTIPAADTRVDIYVYPDETNEAHGSVTVDRISANWGTQPVAGVAQLEAAAAPTEGTWRVGEIVYNSAPAGGGYVGWICVAAGTPGTWKTFGAITA